MADDNGKDAGVGYGRPPQATQFKKGQSGNPRGRPRKPRGQGPPDRDCPIATIGGMQRPVHSCQILLRLEVAAEQLRVMTLS